MFLSARPKPARRKNGHTKVRTAPYMPATGLCLTAGTPLADPLAPEPPELCEDIAVRGAREKD
jgi:hypothetical protein